MAVGFFRTSTKSRHERGYGYEWEKRRAVKLKLKPLCEYCEEKGRITIATEVDHVIPKSKGGTDEPSNLKSCCRACNLSKTVKDKR